MKNIVTPIGSVWQQLNQQNKENSYSKFHWAPRYSWDNKRRCEQGHSKDIHYTLRIASLNDLTNFVSENGWCKLAFCIEWLWKWRWPSLRVTKIGADLVFIYISGDRLKFNLRMCFFALIARTPRSPFPSMKVIQFHSRLWSDFNFNIAMTPVQPLLQSRYRTFRIRFH